MLAAGTGCAVAPSNSEPPAPYRDVLLGGTTALPAQPPPSGHVSTCTNTVWLLQMRHGRRRPVFHRCIFQSHCSFAPGYLWSVFCIFAASNAGGYQAWLAGATIVTVFITIIKLEISLLFSVLTGRKKALESSGSSSFWALEAPWSCGWAEEPCWALVFAHLLLWPSAVPHSASACEMFLF